jgi:hypothetical protein
MQKFLAKKKHSGFVSASTSNPVFDKGESASHVKKETPPDNSLDQGSGPVGAVVTVDTGFIQLEGTWACGLSPDPIAIYTHYSAPLMTEDRPLLFIPNSVIADIFKSNSHVFHPEHKEYYTHQVNVLYHLASVPSSSLTNLHSRAPRLAENGTITKSLPTRIYDRDSFYRDYQFTYFLPILSSKVVRVTLQASRDRSHITSDFTTYALEVRYQFATSTQVELLLPIPIKTVDDLKSLSIEPDLDGYSGSKSDAGTFAGYLKSQTLALELRTLSAVINKNANNQSSDNVYAHLSGGRVFNVDIIPASVEEYNDAMLNDAGA